MAQQRIDRKAKLKADLKVANTSFKEADTAAREADARTTSRTLTFLYYATRPRVRDHYWPSTVRTSEFVKLAHWDTGMLCDEHLAPPGYACSEVPPGPELPMCAL